MTEVGITILSLRVRKLSNWQRRANYSNRPAGFTAWPPQLPSLCPWAKLALCPRCYTASPGATTGHHAQADHEQDCAVGRTPSAPPGIPRPLFSLHFNVPISPRSPQVSSRPGSPRCGGKCYCPPRDNAHCREDLTRARHDAECRWPNMNRKPLQRTHSTARDAEGTPLS